MQWTTTIASVGTKKHSVSLSLRYIAGSRREPQAERETGNEEDDERERKHRRMGAAETRGGWTRKSAGYVYE